MNLTVRSHHAALPDDFRPHAEKKLGRLERLLPRLDSVVVEVGHEETRVAAHRFSVQVTVHSGPSILRAEERAADPAVALDAASEVLLRQARRHKQRLDDRHHPHGAKEIAADAVNARPRAGSPRRTDDGDEVEYVLGKIVRIKRFEAKPMSEEEALAQMDLLGHDFFLFLDAGSGDYALLYHRKDGDYGMLTPERG